ncbi:hypothetical protein BE221DRAFT_73528 [Ostreococcus tauri]|uniref:Uncharacterized protein n=1 Tax=Ostreococcus tauri TaxID=70448 RepID=A0A1Y5IAZ0_OSTTA|nr:hypothetical protein BE221DRAFT_73528 [Ostreococcus tauri]
MGVRSGASGRSRGSEVYGERAVDDARDALRDRVRAFEARADGTNPEHARALVEMREATRAVERLRGTWSRRGLPGVARDWSERRESDGREIAPPRSCETYDAYCRCARSRDG